MNRDNTFASALVALGLAALSSASTAAAIAPAGFVLDPATSRISVDYFATLTMTVSGGGVSSSDSFTLNKHFDESASGSLSASANASGLTFNGGSINATYTGDPIPAGLSLFGGMMTIDFTLLPKSWTLALPSFDAGTLTSSTPSQQAFGPQQVDFSVADDSDFSITLHADGEAPETVTGGGPSSYAFTGSVFSTISLGALGEASGLLLRAPGPFSENYSDSTSQNDPTVGLITMELSGTETWSNLQVELAPVPLPGGAWLFGSALVGIFGFGRRQIHRS